MIDKKSEAFKARKENKFEFGSGTAPLGLAMFSSDVLMLFALPGSSQDITSNSGVIR